MKKLRFPLMEEIHVERVRATRNDEREVAFYKFRQRKNLFSFFKRIRKRSFCYADRSPIVRKGKTKPHCSFFERCRKLVRSVREKGSKKTLYLAVFDKVSILLNEFLRPLTLFDHGI